MSKKLKFILPTVAATFIALLLGLHYGVETRLFFHVMTDVFAQRWFWYLPSCVLAALLCAAEARVSGGKAIAGAKFGLLYAAGVNIATQVDTSLYFMFNCHLTENQILGIYALVAISLYVCADCRLCNHKEA